MTSSKLGESQSTKNLTINLW